MMKHNIIPAWAKLNDEQRELIWTCYFAWAPSRQTNQGVCRDRAFLIDADTAVYCVDNRLKTLRALQAKYIKQNRRKELLAEYRQLIRETELVIETIKANT